MIMAFGLHQLLRTLPAGQKCFFGARNVASFSNFRWTTSKLPLYRHNLKSLVNRHVPVSVCSVQYCALSRQQHSYSAFDSSDTEDEQQRQPRPRRDRIPEEEILDHIRSGDPLSMEEWQELKTKIFEIRPFINNQNIDGILMGLCIKHKLFQVGDSLLKSIEKSGEKPNIATLSNYLKLCYECQAGDVKTVLDICDQIRKEYPMMDALTAERVIYGLASTPQWEDGIELLSTIRLTATPNSGSFNALARAAFDNGDLQKGWELIEQMLEAERRPHPEVYKAWIRQCDRVRGEEASVMVAQLLNFWADHDIRPSLDVAMDLRRHFERDLHSWEGCFTELSPRGSCKECHTVLRPTRIQPSEFDALRDHFFNHVIIDSSIFLKTNPDELEAFQQFLKRTAPYDVVIDGLNVAYATGARNPLEMSQVLARAVQHFANRSQRVLVLGRRHMQNWPRTHMNYVHEHASVFLTQDQSQDDPFLLFAAMYSGPRTHFLSKDLMRSHVFLLKDPALRRVFKRWQQQRQLHLFRDHEKGISIKRPLHYNPSVQQGPGPVWHVPYDQVFKELPKQMFEPPRHWLCLQNMTNVDSR